MYPVGRITGEGRADFIRRGGLGLNKRERGGGGRGGQWREEVFNSFLSSNNDDIDVGVRVTRGARSRRWCGWW